jgi:hypothetical protein
VLRAGSNASRGAPHENLPTDHAEHCPFGGRSLHFSVRTAPGNALAVAVPARLAHVASTQTVAAGYHLIVVLKLDAATTHVSSGKDPAELPFAACLFQR